MAVTDEQIAFVHDLFAEVGPITTRKMFGGLGVYADGTIFALLMSDGTLRLKGAGDMIDRYEAMGLRRWTYTRDSGKTAAMPYWELPASAQDDPEEACALAREALRHL